MTDIGCTILGRLLKAPIFSLFMREKNKQCSTDITGFLTSTMRGTQSVEPSKHSVHLCRISVIEHIKLFAHSSLHMVNI